MTKALFWDFDGTLVHPNQSFFNALQAALTEQNYDIPADELKIFLNSACSWHNYDIVYPDKTGEQWWEALFEKLEIFLKEHVVAAEDFSRIKARFREKIIDSQNYVLYEDAKAVLATCLEMGYKNYVISNNYPELPQIINDFGLSQFFTEYFVSANIGYEKPRRELFQYALERAGFPECCYMIGDNPVADILGGKAAGMKTILVHQDGRYEESFNCKTLSEIPGLLE